MNTYKELQAQIEKLQLQAEEARKNELASAIAEIKSKMQEYVITPAELGLTGINKEKTGKAKPVAEAKYRNANTGDTWSGRGKPPKWIAGQDRAQFLIK